jgi:hypothetical protein
MNESALSRTIRVGRGASTARGRVRALIRRGLGDGEADGEGLAAAAWTGVRKAKSAAP